MHKALLRGSTDGTELFLAPFTCTQESLMLYPALTYGNSKFMLTSLTMSVYYQQLVKSTVKGVAKNILL